MSLYTRTNHGGLYTLLARFLTETMHYANRKEGPNFSKCLHILQVTYQLKILTTALFSVIMLSKKLSALQWTSLLVLFLGVALVQLQGTTSDSHSEQQQNHILGLIAVIVSCLSSGFAGVYFEKMLKGSDASVWLRNVQLGIFGSMTALIGMWMKDGADIQEKGFFFAYTPLVWAVIIQQAVGGLIVALVVRYADNILKGFATSLSIILSCLASIPLFSYSLSVKFVIGTVLVVAAIYLYGRPQQQPQKLTPAAAILPTNKDNGGASEKLQLSRY